VHYAAGCPEGFRFAVELVAPAFDVVPACGIADHDVVAAEQALDFGVDFGAGVFFGGIVGTLISGFRFEVVDMARDGESAVADVVDAEFWGACRRGWRQGGDTLLEVGEDLAGSMGFAGGGVTGYEDELAGDLVGM
jgi:hypothetical protein